MAKIRVDPAILTTCSGSINSTASNVSITGKSAQSASMSAPSYDGQFGPKVKAIGAEAFSRANSINNNLLNRSNDLTYRAQLFQNADQFNGSVINVNKIGIGLPPGSTYLNSTIPVYDGSGNQVGNLVYGKLELFPGMKLDADLIRLSDQKNLWQSGPGRPPEPKDQIGIKFPAADYTYISDHTDGESIILGGIRTGGTAGYDIGQAEGGIGVGMHGGQPYAGLYGEVTGLSGNVSGIIGTTDLGVGVGLEGKALSAEGFLGVRDGAVGALVGGTIVAVEGEVGMNIEGTSVGLVAGIGLQFNLGFSLGGENSRIYLGPFTIGLKIGEALGS